MKEELQAVWLEKKELAQKCNSQNSITKSLQQEIELKQIKMEILQHNTKSMTEKGKALEEERDWLAQKFLKFIESEEDCRSHIRPSIGWF
jgi:hypothetical protein